jgi:O-antigen ligase
MLVAAGSVGFAVVVGVTLAINPAYGIALVLAAAYGLLLLFAPTWALICFVPLIFLESVSALNLAGKAAGLLVVGAWLSAVISRQVDLGGFIRRHRRLFEAIVALLVWLCLGAIWAVSPGAIAADIWHWFAIALLYAVVATWIEDEQTLLRFCGAFVIGATLGVLVGVASGSVEGGGDARLEGGAGDPNFLAAGLVPAMVMAAGIMVAVKGPLVRLGCFVAILICTYGVAASQSHGGALALGAVAIAALFVFKRRRIYVALACLAVVAVGAAYFASTPAAWERVSHVENGGSGREDLWTVAWRVAMAHPVLGVGLDNYEVVAKDYTRVPGALKNVNKIAEKPHVVHNTYLEALTETGIVGLLLFLFIAFTSLFCAYRAGKWFEGMGNLPMEALSRAIVVGTIGIMVAGFFVSAGVDKRLWVLLALGPAALTIARIQAERPRLVGRPVGR